MKKENIYLRVDAGVKKQAQKTAKDLGIPLSTVINAFLKEFIRKQSVSFTMRPDDNKAQMTRLEAQDYIIEEYLGKNNK